MWTQTYEKIFKSELVYLKSKWPMQKWENFDMEHLL